MFNRRKKDKKRHSMFVEDLIQENSKVHCTCELYVPEPTFKYDDFGAVKEICLSGDVENFLWSKHCTVHLCELPFYDPNVPISLVAIGVDFEVCFIFSFVSSFFFSDILTHYQMTNFKLFQIERVRRQLFQI